MQSRPLFYVGASVSSLHGPFGAVAGAWNFCFSAAAVMSEETPVILPEPEPEEQKWCFVCLMLVNGPTQWEDHIIGKKHRKNKRQQKLQDHLNHIRLLNTPSAMPD